MKAWCTKSYDHLNIFHCLTDMYTKVKRVTKNHFRINIFNYIYIVIHIHILFICSCKLNTTNYKRSCKLRWNLHTCSFNKWRGFGFVCVLWASWKIVAYLSKYTKQITMINPILFSFCSDKLSKDKARKINLIKVGRNYYDILDRPLPTIVEAKPFWSRWIYFLIFHWFIFS